MHICWYAKRCKMIIVDTLFILPLSSIWLDVWLVHKCIHSKGKFIMEWQHIKKWSMFSSSTFQIIKKKKCNQKWKEWHQYSKNQIYKQCCLKHSFYTKHIHKCIKLNKYCPTFSRFCWTENKIFLKDYFGLS